MCQIRDSIKGKIKTMDGTEIEVDVEFRNGRLRIIGHIPGASYSSFNILRLSNGGLAKYRGLPSDLGFQLTGSLRKIKSISIWE